MASTTTSCGRSLWLEGTTSTVAASTAEKDGLVVAHEAFKRMQQQKSTLPEFMNLRSHSNIQRLVSSMTTGLEECTTTTTTTLEDNNQQALLYATTERLIVVCPGCEPDWTSPQMQALFDAIGQLQCLTSLTFNCVGLLDVALPLPLLTKIVKNCPQLQELDLNDVLLSISSAEEVEELVQALQQRQQQLSESTHTTPITLLQPLTKFRLFGCLSNDTLHLLYRQRQDGTSMISLDSLWTVLATLEFVELDAVDDGLLGSISAASVQQLTASKSIHTLTLNGFVLDNDCLDGMATSLSTNTTLQHLSFALYSLGHPGQGAAFFLTEALRRNEHLDSLRISMSHAWNDATFMQSLASALATDCTLKSLTIATCAQITETTGEAFAKMMASNHALEILELSTYHGPWKSNYLYYAQLNRQRRGYFHANSESISRKEWVEQGLLPVVEDTGALYYFLHMNPALCCPPLRTSAATTTTTTTTTVSDARDSVSYRLSKREELYRQASKGGVKEIAQLLRMLQQSKIR